MTAKGITIRHAIIPLYMHSEHRNMKEHSVKKVIINTKFVKCILDHTPKEYAFSDYEQNMDSMRGRSNSVNRLQWIFPKEILRGFKSI